MIENHLKIKKISQNAMILNYLQAGNKLTALEAKDRFDCMRLSGRIYDLRQLGYPIYSKLIQDEFTNKRFSQYWMGS